MTEVDCNAIFPHHIGPTVVKSAELRDHTNLRSFISLILRLASQYVLFSRVG